MLFESSLIFIIVNVNVYHCSYKKSQKLKFIRKPNKNKKIKLALQNSNRFQLLKLGS